MKKTNILASAALMTLACALSASADINLNFDGMTTDGWTATDGNPLTPTNTVHGASLNALEFEDSVLGYAYYTAPASFITGLDLTGETLNFNFYIEDNSATSVLADEATGGPSDLKVNGTFIAGLDIIDEGQLGTLQSISVDFSDPAFSGVDLTNITELGIRAEYWKSGPGIDPVESYLTSVPEPASVSLIGTALLGLFLARRRK